MKQPILFGTCLLVCMVAGCGEDKDNLVNACNHETFVSTCSVDMTGVTACQNGLVVKIECPSHQCDASNNECVQNGNNAESCTPASYPPGCKDSSTRTYCNVNVKASERCGEGTVCSGGNCQPVPESEKCTESDYPSTCLDSQTRRYCDRGTKSTEDCGADKKCEVNACVPKGNQETCTELDYPPDCINSNERSYCNGGYKDVETCTNGTVCVRGICQSPNTCDPSTFKESCETPLVRVYCDGNTIKRETCTAGAVCNSSLSKIQCKTPAVNDACDPLAFSEMCYGSNQARICDEETRKVVDIDCKDYGKGYTCDIAENFYGPGLNATMCFSKDENCSSEGDEEYNYCYEDDETGFRHFYKIIYTCTEFNLGYHLYTSDFELCPDNGKCGQREIRHACDDL